MEISGFSSSVSGIRAALTRQAVVGNDIANINTPGFEEGQPRQVSRAEGGTKIAAIVKRSNPSTEFSGTNLAEETVEQIMAEKALMANVDALRTQDRMMGELINLKA